MGWTTGPKVGQRRGWDGIGCESLIDAWGWTGDGADVRRKCVRVGAASHTRFVTVANSRVNGRDDLLLLENVPFTSWLGRNAERVSEAAQRMRVLQSVEEMDSTWMGIETDQVARARRCRHSDEGGWRYGVGRIGGMYWMYMYLGQWVW